MEREPRGQRKGGMERDETGEAVSEYTKTIQARQNAEIETHLMKVEEHRWERDKMPRDSIGGTTVTWGESVSFWNAF